MRISTTAAKLIALLSAAIPMSSLSASETITYTYDARGRLIAVSRGGQVNDGAQTTYDYDAAGNRLKVTASGAGSGGAGGSGGSGPGDGGAERPVKYVVVPLNGFTIIPVR